MRHHRPSPRRAAPASSLRVEALENRFALSGFGSALLPSAPLASPPLLNPALQAAVQSVPAPVFAVLDAAPAGSLAADPGILAIVPTPTPAIEPVFPRAQPSVPALAEVEVAAAAEAVLGESLKGEAAVTLGLNLSPEPIFGLLPLAPALQVAVSAGVETAALPPAAGRLETRVELGVGATPVQDKTDTNPAPRSPVAVDLDVTAGLNAPAAAVQVVAAVDLFKGPGAGDILEIDASVDVDTTPVEVVLDEEIVLGEPGPGGPKVSVPVRLDLVPEVVGALFDLGLEGESIPTEPPGEGANPGPNDNPDLADGEGMSPPGSGPEGSVEANGGASAPAPSLKGAGDEDAAPGPQPGAPGVGAGLAAFPFGPLSFPGFSGAALAPALLGVALQAGDEKSIGQAEEETEDRGPMLLEAWALGQDEAGLAAGGSEQNAALSYALTAWLAEDRAGAPRTSDLFLEASGLLTEVQPFGLADLERALQEFLDQLAALQQALQSLLARLGPWPWVLTGIALAAVAGELARRRLRHARAFLATDAGFNLAWSPELGGSAFAV